MSSAAFPAPANGGVALWSRQALAVMRLELRKNLSVWRGLVLLFLAFAPVLIITAHSVYDRDCHLEAETLILAGIFQFYYLRFAIFFGCLAIALTALRGEVAEKTLHYAFLAPVRREVLVVGKFLSGVATAVLAFGLGVTLAFTLMYAHFQEGQAFAAQAGGRSHLAAYLLVTALACVGYSAVFLALGLVAKNPIVPTMLVLVWEIVHGALPVWLKRFSVTYYLKPLLPVELPLEGFGAFFTVVAEPMPAWLAVTGLLAFALAVLAFACWRIRRFEISYSTD